MGIKNYVRQVRPVQEAHVNHLEKIQRVLSEDKDSDVQAVINSVEGGKIALYPET